MNKQNKVNVETMRKLYDLTTELQFLERACQLKRDAIRELKNNCNHEYVFYLGEDTDTIDMDSSWKKYYVCAVCGEKELLPIHHGDSIDASSYKSKEFSILELQNVQKGHELRKLFKKTMLEHSNCTPSQIKDMVEEALAQESNSVVRIRR